jgi:hypothetical protein
MYSVAGKLISGYNGISCSLRRKSNDIVVFDTAELTDNLGDQIIMRFCEQRLRELFTDYRVLRYSTHACPPAAAEKDIRRAAYRFVCGTNLLTSHIEQHWNWTLPPGVSGKWPYRNSILFGVGWHSYQDKCSEYTKLVYREILHPRYLHSVRDSYSEDKLKEAGFRNVINTGCPTMWGLTPAFCATIPEGKAKNVVATITDYRRDPERDRSMLELLLRRYDRVYLWLQGRQDAAYLAELKVSGSIQTVPRSLEAYEALLTQGDVDYVGTRLHAGIFALNHRVRSIVIAVDNRAAEIAKDTNLTICPRELLTEQLEAMILSQQPCGIQIPQEAIERFLSQFS